MIANTVTDLRIGDSESGVIRQGRIAIFTSTMASNNRQKHQLALFMVFALFAWAGNFWYSEIHFTVTSIMTIYKGPVMNFFN